MSGDPRLTPARADLAAEHLRATIDAPRYAPGEPRRVAAAKTGLFRRPGGGLDTELLHGEDFTVYDSADGFAWGQSALDGYVGYVAEPDLVRPGPAPTHRVVTLAAQFYREPKLKLPPAGSLPFGARLHVARTTETHAQVGQDSWAPLPQLAALDDPAADWVAVAEMMAGAPYVWGGRSAWGVDCSGLVQLALQASGRPCPRDSDMQAAALGETLPEEAALARGDLIFWTGHVGIMLTATELLHANAHRMAVATEPLSEAVQWIADKGFGAVTRRARLDPEATAA